MQAPETLELLAGEFAEFPLGISILGMCGLMYLGHSRELPRMAIGLQSISPSFIEPNQDLTLVMGVGVPAGWPVIKQEK